MLSIGAMPTRIRVWPRPTFPICAIPLALLSGCPGLNETTHFTRADTTPAQEQNGQRPMLAASQAGVIRPA
jgi:hypothetical protein